MKSIQCPLFHRRFDDQYSLDLQGFMSPQEFASVINTFNEAVYHTPPPPNLSSSLATILFACFSTLVILVVIASIHYTHHLSLILIIPTTFLLLTTIILAWRRHCTASLPLINSLTHLAYLTSTSPRIREILVMDGGLERLVRLMSPQHHETGRRQLWKWSLAFQCVVNIGVRGTEHIRTKVVEAGMIPIVLRVLDNFLKALEIVRKEADKGGDATRALPGYSADWYSDSRTTRPVMLYPLAVGYHSYVNMVNTSNDLSDSSSIPPSDQTTSPTRHQRVIRRSTFPYMKPTAAQRRKQRQSRDPSSKSVPTWQDAQLPTIDNVYYREEDILLSLQLLAYLSKYPHIRDLFHTAYSKNVFSVVEQFCHRRHPNPIQYWAGVIMRNACRKDETKGGTRRCANMHCGKWESQPREFAKCRRCRKAKYCCKACQSRAWADGHRWWCVERHASVSQPEPSSSSAPAQTQPVTSPQPPSTSPLQQESSTARVDLALTNPSQHAPSSSEADNAQLLMDMEVSMEL
ncbi:hypothetical protein DM01DRAFT_1410341 [Hesseltinella vesiculosa]|uniref:MYND-type domain-containing protein n=1 Tax=Hesseltinella vesiculosa TaxID=101127 RepID=A0A1X2G8Z8_9FUNG|nr:hypothetical protein DM01DRAFT_1410341 [Hesseltinella vesiculosa]